MNSEFPAKGKKFHCVRGKFMFPCLNRGVARDLAKRKAKVKYESYRREATTRYEEILEIEPLLPVET